MCHLIRIDFSKSFCDSLSLVQFAEDSIKATSCCRCSFWSIIKSHRWRRRSGWRRWRWRRSASCFRVWSGREGFVLVHSLDSFFSRDTLGIPGNALRESLLDIFCEVLEDLVIGIDPFDLLRVPVNPVSSERSSKFGFPYFSLNSFRTRFPQYCAEPKDSSTCLCGLGDSVTQASTPMLSETVDSWLKRGFPRFESRISLTAVIISCSGFKSSMNTGLLMSGFFDFVVMRMNFRCLTNA